MCQISSSKDSHKKQHAGSSNMCSYEKKNFSPWDSVILLGKISHGCRKSFSQLHMLGELEYLFFGKSFDPEIWHSFYQYRDDLMTNIPW